MRLSEPRVEPRAESEWSEELRQLLGRTAKARDGKVLNIHATLAHHPKLLKRWMVFGNHVLRKSTLPARDREILILRIGWRCRSEYEWGQHVLIATQEGLSAEEIRRIAAGPEAEGWDPFEANLLRAADELHADAMIGDATWAALSERYGVPQIFDLIFTVGQYNLVCMALNSLGVRRDEGVPAFPPDLAEPRC